MICNGPQFFLCHEKTEEGLAAQPSNMASEYEAVNRIVARIIKFFPDIAVQFFSVIDKQAPVNDRLSATTKYQKVLRLIQLSVITRENAPGALSNSWKRPVSGKRPNVADGSTQDIRLKYSGIILCMAIDGQAAV